MDKLMIIGKILEYVLLLPLFTMPASESPAIMDDSVLASIDELLSLKGTQLNDSPFLDQLMNIDVVTRYIPGFRRQMGTREEWNQRIKESIKLELLGKIMISSAYESALIKRDDISDFIEFFLVNYKNGVIIDAVSIAYIIKPNIVVTTQKKSETQYLQTRVDISIKSPSNHDSDNTIGEIQAKRYITFLQDGNIRTSPAGLYF